MRLPMDGEKIDVARTQEMVDRFLEEGFRYFDTAYGYNDGESEAVAKKVLVDRYPRDRFLLATKLPAWAGAKNREEAEQMFYTSLERTGAGISISIFFTIWGRSGLAFLMTMISGTFERKEERGADPSSGIFYA